jgi:hypothetical protein
MRFRNTNRTCRSIIWSSHATDLTIWTNLSTSFPEPFPMARSPKSLQLRCALAKRDARLHQLVLQPCCGIRRTSVGGLHNRPVLPHQRCCKRMRTFQDQYLPVVYWRDQLHLPRKSITIPPCQHRPADCLALQMGNKAQRTTQLAENYYDLQQRSLLKVGIRSTCRGKGKCNYGGNLVHAGRPLGNRLSGNSISNRYGNRA